MNSDSKELLRYGANGIVATTVHYAVLLLNLEVLKFHSAGIASLVGACFGIAVSFYGSRYCVFKKENENIVRQAIKFCGLYALIALIHGLTLWWWTDNCGFNYHAGFLFATSLQVIFGYCGNKFLVFNK